MSKEDNPIVSLAGMLGGADDKEQSSEVFRIGKVVSVSPLSVTVGKLQLDDEDLGFLYGVRQQLERGDQLFLIPSADGQRFYVIGEVI